MMTSTEEEPQSEHAKLSRPVIEISSLVFRYPRAKVDTLHIDHWRVSPGEHVFLQGASGSGKSTLLQLLCGLRTGTGQLSIIGTEISALTQAKRDKFRARHIGMVFQQFNLIPYLSAVDNVVLAASLAGRGAGAKTRAEKLLDQVGLASPACKQTAASLSIGQQQRVAISRALINSPEILLLDEPTSALDERNQNLFMTTLMAHLERNPTTSAVFVSHDSQLSSYFTRAVNLTEISSCNSPLETSDGR